MSVDGEAAGSRVPLRHPLLPRWRISLQHLKSGNLAFDLPCPDCDQRHLAVVTVQHVGKCAGTHCGPGPHNHHNEFTPTHNGPSYTDDFYRPGLLATTVARSAAGGPEPVDLL